MFMRFAILSAVAAMFFCSELPAEEPQGSRLLDGIHGALDSGEIEPVQAVRRYRLAARRYRRESSLAGEALFSAGVAYEKLGRFSDAAEAYLAVVSDYPDSTWFMPAVDALIESGEQILGEGNFHSARRIFSRLADVGLPAEQQAFVLYAMGVSALKTGRHIEAEYDFETVLEDYPTEPWKEKAYFKLGKVYAAGVRRPTRDQSRTRKAIEHFESFINRYPDSVLREDAERRLRGLGERKAEYLYHICNFYHRKGTKDACDFYRGILSEKYPETSWAALALEQF